MWGINAGGIVVDSGGEVGGEEGEGERGLNTCLWPYR